MLTDAAGLFGHLSYLLIVLASLLRDILALRVVAVASGAAGLLYAFFWPASPLWIDIGWETTFVVVNLFQIVVLIRERRSARFTDEEEELRQNFFPQLSKVEFKKLLQAGARRPIDAGERLTVEGRPVTAVVFLIDGLATVEHRGEVVACCRRGDFVGEMSFLSGNPAAATVATVAPSLCIEWRAERLRQLLADGELRNAMLTIFSKNLVAKLGAGAARLEGWGSLDNETARK